MDEQPTFSIITASFCQIPWLKLCAASIADQSSVTYEHIIQDGGSGPELIEWTNQTPTIRCFQESDEGMYDALNRGLRRAHGRLLGWLNCDEQYLPGTLHRVERFFSAHPEVDVVFGDVLLVDPTGRAVSYRRGVRPNKIHTRLEHLGTPSCATFFRRKIVDRGLLFDPAFRSVGDAVWIYSLLEHKVPMACLHEPLAVYTFTGANLSETETSLKELGEWRRQPDCPAHWLRGPAVLWHRVRKFIAGAYFPRRVRYSIYTLTSPAQRVAFELSAVHFGWPGVTAPAIPRRPKGTVEPVDSPEQTVPVGEDRAA